LRVNGQANAQDFIAAPIFRQNFDAKPHFPFRRICHRPKSPFPVFNPSSDPIEII